MAANQSIRILVANDAPITAYERCCVFDQLLGDDDRAFTKGVVFNGVLGSFALTAGTRAVTIAGGMASIDGRQFVSSSAVTFDLSAMTGVKYCVIYAEVSTMSVANEFAKLCLAFDSGSFPTVEGNDVVRQERGVARMPLHRFIYSSTGGIVRDAVQLFEGKEPGTAFQTRHLPDNATIYGNDLDELIEENEPFFAKSRNADQTGDAPDLSGNEIDGALCVNNSLASLAVLAFATVTLTPDTCGGHEGGDGASVTVPNESGEATAPSAYWQGGDEYEISYDESTWPDIPHANSRTKIFAWLVQIRLMTTHWNMGFIGIGSHWETRKGLVHNMILPGYGFRSLSANSNAEIRIRCADTHGGQPQLVKEDDFLQTQTQLHIELPNNLPFHSGRTQYPATIKLKVAGEYHWYGRIKLTPLIILDGVDRART